jgi:tetratricopeptide (TPR) repeat protein
MASRVNKKFVLMLSGFLALTAVGAGGAYYFVKSRSGEHYVAMGDKAMAEGKIDAADKWYERAVGKEPYNVAWLTKWRAAREKVVPPPNEYQAKYQMLQGILRNLAQAKKTDIAAHGEALEAVLNECLFTGSRGGFEYLANRVDEVLGYFETDPENPAPPQIRRYRGIALTELMSDPTITKDRIDLCRQDLEAALKLNPGDGEAAYGLAAWHRQMADRAVTAGDDAAAREHRARSREVMAEASRAGAHGKGGLPHPLLPIAILTMDAGDIELMPTAGLSPDEVIRRKTAAMDALAPRVAEVVNQMMAMDPKDVSSLVISRVVAVAPRIDLKSGLALSKSLVDHMLKARPDDMDLLLMRAQLLLTPPPPPEEPAKPEAVMAAFQAVIDLPDKPVSFEGFRLLGTRNRARFAQASVAMSMMGSSSLSEEERRRATATAREKRNELAKHVPESSPEVQFLDAKMAVFDGELARARRLLAEFLRKPGDTGTPSILEAHLMMADIGQRLVPPELGLAREHLTHALQFRPNAAELRMALAGVERALQDYERAAVQYRLILQVNPDHEMAKAELAKLRAVMEGGKLDDPVDQALVDAERLSKGTSEKLGDDAAAMKLLEEAMVRHGYDPRIVQTLARAKFQRGDREGAKQTVATAIAARSGDTSPAIARLRELSDQISATESLEGTLEFLNRLEISELDKKLGQYRAYLEFGKKEEASKALDAAERLSPNDVRVVEARFMDALSKQDFGVAGRLADLAAKENLDQADGDTYRARLQIAQKQYREAAATLARTVERGNAPAAVFRLLGLVQAELGRTQDAVLAFRRALDLVPNDLPTVKLFMNVLVTAGERAEALGVARRAEPVARFDPEFVNMWLQLESDAGRTEFAISRREQVLERNPKDRANAASLAGLYIEAKRWDKARALIDSLRQEKDTLGLAMLDARWHGDRGSLESAIQVMRTFIGTVEDGLAKQEAFVAFGQFLLQRGLQEQGLAALRQAAAHQDPKVMAVDQLIGDVQLNAGLFDLAEKSYRKVLDAGVPDPSFTIRKKLIEALNQMQKFAEAEAIFASLGAEADRDVELMAQRASIARGMGDTARAKAILDRAIQKYPEEPMPYLRRARLAMMDPALSKDVVADLATAIRLRPGFWQALRTRAMIAMGEGRVDEALNDLREAVNRNPGNEDLRLEYLDYLVRLGRESEAVDAADAALATRPNDIRMMSQFASVFARGGRWTRATKYYRMLWVQLQDENSALNLCNALFNSTPPGLGEAETVLNTPALRVDRSWRLLTARAILRKRQGRDAAARDDLLASFEQLSTDVGSFLAWSTDVSQVYPGLLERLQFLSTLRPPTQLAEWMTLVRSRMALEDKASVDTAIDTLRALRDSSGDVALKGEAQVAIAGARMGQSRWEDAIEEIRLGLQYRGNDWILLNNAAAILNEHLNRPQEALPFAERAYALNRGVWQVADTLAAAHWALGAKAEALSKMEEALRLVQSEVDKCRLSIKLASWRYKSGDVQGSRAMADRVREWLTDSPALRDAVKSEYEALVQEIGASVR